MIRRSFIQVLSGMLLPVPSGKSPSGSVEASSMAEPWVAALARSLHPATPACSTPCSWNKAPAVPTVTPSGNAGITGEPCHFARIPTNPDPGWLQEWQRIPRVEIREDGLSKLTDPHQRLVGARILRCIRAATPVSFQYCGGSTPGEMRQVLPTSLFTLAPAEDPPFPHDFPPGPPAFSDAPVYLLAWCLVRNQPRTFRLDRIQLPPATPNPLA